MAFLYLVAMLLLLLAGSILMAVIRKMRSGGPLIDNAGEPRSLRELAERRRAERASAQ